MTIKKIGIGTLATTALASAAMALAATANTAPSGPSSVDSTIDNLRSHGYQVIVNRVGTAPLDTCSVSAVRPGQTYSRTVDDAPGSTGDDIVTTVTGRTVFVDVSC
jgi:hypothetical protein